MTRLYFPLSDDLGVLSQSCLLSTNMFLPVANLSFPKVVHVLCPSERLSSRPPFDILTLSGHVAQWLKNPPAKAGDSETQVQSLGWEDPLEKETTTHSIILAW